MMNSKQERVLHNKLSERLKICLSATSFQFQGQHYELEDNLAMGSPVSSAVANIFTAKLEERALRDFPQPPSTWFRFVDDVFSIAKKSAMQHLLQHLNNQHEAISFTMEVEENGRLPFLDEAVTRCEDGTLKSTVYRKPTHTGRHLYYN